MQLIALSMNLDLLTNATVVDDAITSSNKFKSKYKENLKSFSNNSSEDDKESNEPDYGEDKDQLEEEQEEQTGKQYPSFKFSKLNLRAITTTVQAMAIVKD